MSDQEKMRWYTGRGRHFASNDGCYVARLDNGTLIEIHPERYDEQFQRYLAHLGVKPTSGSTIMKKRKKDGGRIVRQKSNRRSTLLDHFSREF